MDAAPVSEAKRHVVDLLKVQGPRTAGQLARALGSSEVAVRQHLQALEAAGLVAAARAAPRGRGRPSLVWSLTREAQHLFPDRHGELSVGLLAAMREAFGDAGLARVVAARSTRQVEAYRAAMPGGRASLKARVEALAALRSAEGYLAEVVQERPGRYLLIEHHCPICDAARSCQRLCGAELEVFQAALGPDVTVERTAHLLAGDARCVYRVAKR